MLAIGTGVSASGEVKNCYFHGWSRGGTATKDVMFLLTSTLVSEGSTMDLKIFNNVFDGWDSPNDMTTAYKGSAGYFYNNYVANIMTGIVASNIKYVFGNTFKNIAVASTDNPNCPGYFSFDCTAHGNVIYTVGPAIIYNNYIENVGGGVTIWVDPGDNNVAYVFNNVVSKDNNQGIQISNYEYVIGGNSGVYVFNNTLAAKNVNVPGPRIAGPSYTNKPYMNFGFICNNHMIASTGFIEWKMITNRTECNNIGMTHVQASEAGYISTETLPFFPPQCGVTIEKGMNLTELVSTIPSTNIVPASTAALIDTTCGVKYDSINHRVVGPNKTSVVRGTKWDVGAYEFSNSDNRPQPPRNLRIID